MMFCSTQRDFMLTTQSRGIFPLNNLPTHQKKLCHPPLKVRQPRPRTYEFQYPSRDGLDEPSFRYTKPQYEHLITGSEKFEMAARTSSGNCFISCSPTLFWRPSPLLQRGQTDALCIFFPRSVACCGDHRSLYSPASYSLDQPSRVRLYLQG